MHPPPPAYLRAAGVPRSPEKLPLFLSRSEAAQRLIFLYKERIRKFVAAVAVGAGKRWKSGIYPRVVQYSPEIQRGISWKTHKSTAAAEGNSGFPSCGGLWKIGCKPGSLAGLSTPVVRLVPRCAANRAKMGQLYKIFSFPQPLRGAEIGGLCGKRRGAAMAARCGQTGFSTGRELWKTGKSTGELGADGGKVGDARADWVVFAGEIPVLSTDLSTIHRGYPQPVEKCGG